MDTHILADGFAFIEGPRWRNGALWFSDMHGEAVYRLVPGETPEEIVKVPGRPSGLGWLPDGRLLIASMMDKTLLVQTESGALTAYADLSHLAERRINDMVVDAQGRAWIGNFGFIFDEGEDIAPATLAYVAPDGRVSAAAEGLLFPNGSVVTPDGKTLIVAETYGARLTAFDIDPEGNLSGQRIWAGLNDGAVPDGICLDAEGAVWVASPLTGTCLRVKEGGEVLQTVTTGRMAIACALGGPDGNTLFIATSESTSRETCLAAMSARIEAIEVDVPGAGSP